jgi:ribonuclease P protein component
MIGTDKSNNSFGRQFRLRGRSAFLGVIFGRDSRRMKGRCCEMITAEPKVAGKEAEPGTKFGITVTRKAGGAVRRNRLKRIVREFLRTHKSLWPDNKLVVIRINGPVAEEAELIAEIENMLKTMR